MPKRRQRHKQVAGSSGTGAKHREINRLTGEVEQVPIEQPKVPVLFRNCTWSAIFLAWAGEEGLSQGYKEEPKYYLIPPKLGRNALSLYGLDGAKRQTKKIASTSVPVIHFTADSYSKFPGEDDLYHVGLRPDLATTIQLRPELAAAQLLLGFRNPVTFKSLVVASFETEKESNSAAYKLEKFIKGNPDIEHIRLGPLKDETEPISYLPE